MDQPGLEPPAPPTTRACYNLRLDAETAALLHELGAIRGERPGTVARKLVEVHTRQELAAVKASLAEAAV